MPPAVALSTGSWALLRFWHLANAVATSLSAPSTFARTVEVLVRRGALS